MTLTATLMSNSKRTPSKTSFIRRAIFVLVVPRPNVKPIDPLSG